MSISGNVITTFLLALAFGTQLFSVLVNTRLTGVGFFKLGNSIVLAAFTLACASILFIAKFEVPTSSIWAMGLILVTNSLTYVLHRDQKSWFMWTLYGLQILTFCFLVFDLYSPASGWSMFFFYTAGLLGISNFAMILGHYYLVVPKLTEEPLIYTLYVFWTILFLRLMSSVSVFLTAAQPFLQEGTELGDGYTFNWLFISMRYLWGYLAPFILSLFTYRLCRIRSIQSATGVLYIIEFFVIVGEMISIYLMSKHGLAL
jgi:hypothetical protein